jgi:uncharacterized sporulation protein YeaH/YhbH (DUF444 family)
VPRRIQEDHKDFRDVVSGRIRKALKKFIKSGKFTRARGKNGKISISIPQIDIPHIVFGDNDEGIGRGQGEPGDIIDQDPQPGQGAGGDGEEKEGIMITLQLEDILKFMEGELELPRLKPKENDTFDEVKKKYNSISLVGPESLRHTRRMMLQALKRMSATGEINKLHKIPGFTDPVKLILPIASDKRYRQFRDIKLPSSNAAIIFMRDGSGSMDTEKCEIVSDMAWWISAWIKRYYNRVEKMWVWHDTSAKEVDEDTFYRLRQGGGTTVSSAYKLVAEQFDNRFPPDKWNVYVFYFTDGENWPDDNEKVIKLVQEEFTQNRVNFMGVTQILAYNYDGSVKHAFDEAVKQGKLNGDQIRTCSIGPDMDTDSNSPMSVYDMPSLAEDERDEAIMNAIRALLGKGGVQATDS